MTALCGGGTSGPKAGVAETIVYASTAIASLLNNRGGWWAYLVAPLIGVLSYQATELCFTDPPTDPGMTDSDFQAMLDLSNPSAVAVAIGKLTDLAKIAIWYEMCECKTTSTPAAPTVPFDIGVSVTSPGQVSSYVPMLRSQCKVLSLWNGTTNIAPPANWYRTTFNDSAWGSPPLFNDSLALATSYYQNGAVVPLTAPAGSQRPQAVGVATPTNRSQFLIRWRVGLPFFSAADIGVAPGSSRFTFPTGWTTGEVYVNDSPGIAFSASNWQSLETAWRPGATNLVSLWVNSSGGNFEAWNSNEASVQLSLLFPGVTASDAASECCSRIEPALAQLASSMATLIGLVTAVQRQGVPFAYVPGLIYSGLTSIGEITFSDPIVRLKVELTTLPPWYGMAEGSPDRLYEIGWVAIGTSDGFEPPQPITHTPFLLPIRGDITRIGYSFGVGIVASIETYSREP